MGLLSRIFQPSAVKSAEGQFREGPYWLPVTGGWLPKGSPWNFWQTGRDPITYGSSAMVEACVGAYAQTIAMCPGAHWLANGKGGRDRQINSALNRILRKPNDYQSISDFLLNITHRLYRTGNAFAIAFRNDRFEIKELHLMLGDCKARLSEEGELFYTLSGNEILERRIEGPIIVPARDVLHVRLHTPRHPLIGESPLQAAMLDVATANVIGQQQVSFYTNQSRPSFVLSTDQVLTKEQSEALRARWDEQAAGFAAGGTAMMGAGLKPIPLYSSAQDSQLAEVLKMSDQHIALVFGVPLQILGIGGAPLGSTEALMQTWLARGLGFALNHLEEAFGILFGLKGQPEEYIELDTQALLRSAFKDRVEGYARGVQGGIFAPDEARAAFELSESPNGVGKEARVQAQVVPLSAAEEIQSAPSSPAAPAAQVDNNEEAKRIANDNTRALVRAFHAKSFAG
jgi:HK97 family phage portal protein